MEKLLLENLDSIQYEQFIKAFPLYNTYEEAKAKGFIAHHIFPVCLQNKDRKDPELDDRCVRLTPFEHIVAHYLLAKENEDPKLKYSFFCMCYTESSKISKEEKLSLETLHECASLMEKSLENRHFQQKEAWANPELRKRMSEIKKSQYLKDPSIKQKISKTRISKYSKYYAVLTPKNELLIVQNLKEWLNKHIGVSGNEQIFIYGLKGYSFLEVPSEDYTLPQDVFNSFMARHEQDLARYSKVSTFKKREHITYVEPQLEYKIIDPKGNISYTYDVFNWGKIQGIPKDKLHKKCIDLPGYFVEDLWTKEWNIFKDGHLFITISGSLRNWCNTCGFFARPEQAASCLCAKNRRRYDGFYVEKVLKETYLT